MRRDLLGEKTEFSLASDHTESLGHCKEFGYFLKPTRGFPGGAVVKNPPANARDTGSSPGPGRSHMPWSN